MAADTKSKPKSLWSALLLVTEGMRAKPIPGAGLRHPQVADICSAVDTAKVWFDATGDKGAATLMLKQISKGQQSPQ